MPDSPQVHVRYDMRIPMRDGVHLSADLYLPAGDGPHPAIVLRTPYVKASARYRDRGLHWARDGYAFLAVDVRGRGDSEGDFIPYRRDGEDGYDAIEWAGAQGFCTGAVATTGASYSGRVQWLTARLRPPHLKAMIAMVSPSDTFVETPTGVPSPMDICWYHMTSGRTMQDTQAPDWMRIYDHLPLLTMDEALGRDLPLWREALSHQSLDEYWQSLSYQDRFGEIDVPVLHISGWYDDEQIGTPLNFLGMQRGARSEAARQDQRLLMGPWGHHVNGGTRLGEVEFGEDALIDLHGLERRFLDRHLRGLADSGEAPVRIFTMGANAWRDLPSWPPQGMRQVPYYLHSQGAANSRLGDGALSPEPPGDEPADGFRYDPARPVPFITEPTSIQIGGPDDYAAVERRDDVLCYTTPLLEEPLELTGPISLLLYAQSSAPDTDFTAKLVDVWPNGFCQRVCDGMVRLRYRDGFRSPKLAEPGELLELTIDLWNTSLVVGKGHAIRLEVSSSAFPKFPRNLNTGEDLATSGSMAAADQAIFHDHRRPSQLLLPVVRD
ncbi:MAG: CocE/NonD family hydrolase [Thermaerobacter sp.]|nr:CocE/NonD family hydrolase [Thermaerobacter sp.]